MLFFYDNFIRNVSNKNIIIDIPRGSNLKTISKVIEYNELTSNSIFPFFLSIILRYEKKLNFGEYLVTNEDTIFTILKKIRYGKIFYRKITIIEGYEKFQLLELINSSMLLSKNSFIVEKYNLIGETFYYSKYQTADNLFEKIHNFTNNFLKNNNISKYSDEELLIISSLVEKEGMNDNDKRIISSVIFNRLKKNMKLDIDATVIYSITKGEYKLSRPLNYDDLKIDSAYNTYLHKGLPPGPICIPGLNTLKIVLENYESPYLYYFFNDEKNVHIFTENFKEHKKKLNEYRKSK